MDHNLSQVPKKSNTPDTEGHNGRTGKTGIVILDPLLKESIGWQIYFIKAMNQLTTSVGSLAYSSTGIAATQARFYKRLLASPLAL
jgi:hypothetical protein